MVGIQTVDLPPRADRFLAPALLAIGLSVIAVRSSSSPGRWSTGGCGRDGRPSSGPGTSSAGTASSTLDYFALRADKRWFFHRDTLVAYAVYGGVCLISPDPIGPRNEREQVWAAFRRFADTHGWTTAVMGAGEDWLPVYRESGMHHIYLGDEAVVHVQEFASPAGHEGAAPGPSPRSRNTATRSPSTTRPGSTDDGHRADRPHGPEPAGRARAWLLDDARPHLRPTGHRPPAHRRADTGRPAGGHVPVRPVPGINGFSLDLMRRDPADHPNGLLDFALC